MAWRARDRRDGTDLAIKQLSLSAAPDWKSVELFEREAETLESLDHPQVPDYVDYHHVEDTTDGKAQFYLVQEYVSGVDLESELDQGAIIFNESEVRELLEELLEVAAYLHDHTPPVVHRDIKPSNIILRDEEPLALVDFGAVQVVAPDTQGGSTIIGTTGYLPVEQLMGRAGPASDVYAIGATAIHVLTRTHPAELEVERNRLKFRDKTSVSENLARLLERMTAPAAEDRYADAGEVLEALRTGRIDAPSDAGALALREPGVDAVSGSRGEELEARLQQYRDQRYLSSDVLLDARCTVLEQVSRSDSAYILGTPASQRGNSSIPYRRCWIVNADDALIVRTDHPGPKVMFALLVAGAVLGGLFVNPVLWAGFAFLHAVRRTNLRLRVDDQGYELESGVFHYESRAGGDWDSIEGFDADGRDVRALPTNGEPVEVAELPDRATAKWLAERLDRIRDERVDESDMTS